MFSKLTGYISRTAITGLMVASIGGALLSGAVAAHAGPLDDVSAGAANVAATADGDYPVPVTCIFNGQVYRVGDTRTADGVTFACTPSGTWATVDPGGLLHQRPPHIYKGVVSLVK